MWTSDPCETPLRRFARAEDFVSVTQSFDYVNALLQVSLKLCNELREKLSLQTRLPKKRIQFQNV